MEPFSIIVLDYDGAHVCAISYHHSSGASFISLTESRSDSEFFPIERECVVNLYPTIEQIVQICIHDVLHTERNTSQQ